MDNDSSYRCSSCGAAAQVKCECGAPCHYIIASEAARLGIAAYPSLSARQIAEIIGVSPKTVDRELEQAASNDATGSSIEGTPYNTNEKRRGKDGKFYPVKRSRLRTTPGRGRYGKAEITKDEEVALACAVLDEDKSLEAASHEAGLKSDMVARFAVAREQGRREERADPLIDPVTLSITAQAKLEMAIRQHKKQLDSEFEAAVLKEISDRVAEYVAPRFVEREKDAERVRNAYRQQGVFTREEYNIILRCLHPDLSPSIEQKNEAFRLLHENRLLLLSEKDDPRTYPAIPTAEEFMAGVRRPKRT